MTKRKLGKGPRKQATPRKTKPRNRPLPGMDDPVIQEIEDAAEAYAEDRDVRIAKTTLETASHDALLAVMAKHGRQVYKRNGITATVSQGKTKVKVKIEEPEEPGVEA